MFLLIVKYRQFFHYASVRLFSFLFSLRQSLMSHIHVVCQHKAPTKQDRLFCFVLFFMHKHAKARQSTSSPEMVIKSNLTITEHAYKNCLHFYVANDFVDFVCARACFLDILPNISVKHLFVECVSVPRSDITLLGFKPKGENNFLTVQIT